MNSGLVIFIVIMAVIALGSFVSFIPQIRLYNTAKAAGVDIKFSRILGMKIRRTDPSKLIPLLIKAKRFNVAVTPDMLETQRLARGNVARVVEALITAKEKSIPLEFKLAAAVDLSGGDPVEFIDKLTEKTFTEQGLREAAHKYLEFRSNSEL